LAQRGDPLNVEVLHHKVQQLYASADNQADPTLQIMTIHNAKGLEFDTVILPHLERQSPHDDKQLLLWMERSLQNKHHALLIAPIPGVGHDPDPIYDYIKHQHTIKSEYENARLLYVAITRAKKRLHLLFSVEKNKKPASTSLLGKCWHSIASTIQINAVPPYEMTPGENKKYISRLSLHWENPLMEQHGKIIFHNQTSGFRLTDNTPQLIGTFIHRMLQQMSQGKKTVWESLSTELQKQYIQKNLIQLGLKSEKITETTQIILIALQNTLADPRGQWIMQNHPEAKSEFQLTAWINNRIESLIIDRTFVDEKNIRWIIDYKTTMPQDERVDDFILSEKEKYSQKMLLYAEAIKKLDHRPILFGLYFPLVPSWYQWQ
jgi:ATP-dependent exoDNAse (exonuclease V) beta subunit